MLAYKLYSDERGEGIHISGIDGDVIGVGVKGSGNIIGKNISIRPERLQKIPKEYTDSLKAFADAINQKFKDNNVPSDKVAVVQKYIDEFSKELEGIKPQQELGVIKKTSLKSKLIDIAKTVLPILPRTLQVLTAFTPLAPFSGLIGEDTQILVKAVQNEI